jgi:hypothetical protein
MTEPYDYNDDGNSAEALDEDRLAVDPLERGIEPPEKWAEADKFGVTGREQAEGEPLDARLAEEEPDVQPEDEESPAREVLDDSIDEQPLDYSADEAPPPRTASERLPEAARRGQAADVPGGSVAEALREEA